MKVQIILPDNLRQQMYKHALSDPSHEICGLLGGQRDNLTSYYPVKNIAEDPARRYLMDPAGQIAALKQMRDQDEVLTAIFHSHTDAPAQPSSTDLDMAYYPDVTYLILTLQTTPPELNAFFFDGTQFIPQQIQLNEQE